MLGRTTLLALVIGCGHPARPAPQRPASARAARTAATVDRAPRLAFQSSRASDGLIDATFDQEARGGRPTWSPPPAVAGGIRVTLELVTAEARLCFAGALEPAVDVAFTVTPGGRASDVIVESVRVSARDCLVGALRRAVFPVSRRSWRVAHVFRL